MSLWSDFTKSVSTRVVAPVKNVFEGLVTGTLEPIIDKPKPGTEKELKSIVQGKLRSLNEFAINSAEVSTDILLRAAINLNNKVISPYITRPMSTLALISDVNSPLYKKGEYEEGFQFADIKRAYDRSAYVSTAQALTKSSLVNVIPVLGNANRAWLNLGGIKLDEIDLWDDESIQKNFSENVVGKYYTGTLDFFIGNKGIGTAARLVGKVGKTGLKTTGIYSKEKTIAEFKADIDTGIQYANSNGAAGRQTIAGNHMLQLAESTSINEIDDIVQLYSNNERLSSVLVNVKNPEIARDFILADKGDMAALGRLAETHPDDLFDVADVATQLKNKYILDGNIYNPDGPAVPRLKKAFDNAIAKDPRMEEIRRVFFDESEQLRNLGKVDYFPAEVKFAANAYGKTESAIRLGKSLTKYDEFTGKGSSDALSEVLSLRLGTKIGAPTVTLIKFKNAVSGLKPLRYVTLSGMRPFDARIELNAFIDNMPVFKDGNAKIMTAPNVFRKAADVRREMEESLIKAKTPQDKYKVLEQIDEQLGKIVAYQHGHYTESALKAQIAQMRSNVSTNKRVFEKNGYSVNADGSFNQTNIETTRQMAESYLFTPWDLIEREFINTAKTGIAGKLVTPKNTIATTYESLTRLWTFNALARPMFIIKQSIAEPMISAAIALGPGAAFRIGATALKNATKNTNNFTKNLASKGLNAKDLKAINKAVTAKQKTISLLIAQKDELTAAIDDMVTGKVSPAAKSQNLNKLNKYLKAVDELIDNAELDLIDMTAPLGKTPKVANAPSLKRKIDYIEKNASAATLKKVQPKIDAAKLGLSKYNTVLAKMATNGKVLKDADDALAKAYDDIDNIIKENAELLEEQAEVFGRSAQFKKRYYGKKDNYRMFNGQYVKVTSFFDDETGNNFSRAVRAEVDNTNTVEQTFLGELSVGNRQAILASKVPNMPIDITNPLYFDELQHVANNLIRGDELMDFILSNPPTTAIKSWVTSREGKRYLAQFDVYDKTDGLAYVKDKFALVNRMFPSKEAQSIILQREIRADELQKLLSPYAKDNRLFPIAPSDWSYAESAMVGQNATKIVDGMISRGASKIFRLLNAPENPIRENFFDEIAMTKLAQKAQVLADQGVDVTVSQWNALRQAAGREALQETEKTFYTVRRQNSILYAMRAAAAFPTASLNAFYRYGRLGIKNPGRMLGFTYNYGRTFENFGVDKNGNPTDNIDDIAWLVIPGTQDFGPSKGDGLKLNARSLGYLLNYPSPSFITAISTANIFKNWPTAEDYASGKKGPEWLQKMLGGLYNSWFPYGPQDSPIKAFTPSWGNAVYNYAFTPMGKTDFLQSVNSIYRYHKMLYDMGIDKEPITEEQAIAEARGLWFQKFKNSFVSPFGVPLETNLYPASMIDNLYNTLVNKYQTQGKNREEAKTLAGDELLATVGTDLVLENVTFKDYNKNIPGVVPTVENYNRIFKDNEDLVKQLSQIKDGDISLVGLLGADIEYKAEDRNTAISRLLNDPKLKLPGTSKYINDLKLTPAEEDLQRQKNILWGRYTALKETLTAQITDGKSFRSHKELGDYLAYVASTTFREESQAWYDEYMAGVRGDNSYNYARALKLITTNDDFMKKNGDTEYWKDAQMFMNLRDQVAALYKSFPDGDPRKSKMRDAYLAYIDANISAFHPKLQTMIKIYFDNDTLKVVE